MKTLFWLCWIVELIVVFWWIITDAKQKNLAPNPISYLCLFYLLGVIAIRLGLHWIKLSNIMVIIPGILLIGLGLIILISVLSRQNWN